MIQQKKIMINKWVKKLIKTIFNKIIIKKKKEEKLEKNRKEKK